MQRMNRRGQSVTEYVIVISVVAAAVIGMQIFVKRGLQAKQGAATQYLSQVNKVFTAETGETVPTTMGTTIQYEPYYTAAGKTTTTTTNLPYDEVMSAGGKIARTNISDTTTRTGLVPSVQGADLGADSNWDPPPADDEGEGGEGI